MSHLNAEALPAWADHPHSAPRFASAQEVKCPTLVIYDPADPIVPQPRADWALSAIPGARARELHAGGHLIWMGKDAERMQRERLAFLREHAA